MALDFISTHDTRFLADNLLSSEDWVGEDFNHLHDNGFSNGFANTDELVRDFSSFEDESLKNGACASTHTMLDDNSISDYPWMREDEVHAPYTIEGVFIKSEPLSPPPSSSSSDASGDSFPVSVKLESPPMTPPRDNADVHPHPIPNGLVKVVTPMARIAPKQPTKSPATPIAPRVSQPSGKEAFHKTGSGNKPIVLTQADVARLTAQGVIKCAPPPAKQAKTSSSHTVASVPVAAKPVDHQTAPANVDIRAWKRQQRMIKNRESACLSRKKKKEYLQGLEGKMESIENENSRLVEENHFLRNRVEELLQENNRLRKLQSLLPSSNKTATCLLALVLLLGLNFAPFSIIGAGEDKYSSQHSGRALLGYQEAAALDPGQSRADSLPRSDDYGQAETAMHNASDEGSLARTTLSRKELLVIRDMADYMLSKELQPSCPTLNMTESHRLADVLMGWAQKHQDEQRKYSKEQRVKEKKRKTPKKKPAKPNPFRRRDPQARPVLVDPDETGLQVYDSLFQQTYDNILDSLERRDDTFYVVSFRRDHTLLPATAHNNTQRPRMSLVMPSVGINESSLHTPKDHISMMQIDCEVMNTKMVYLKESHIASPKNNTVTNHPVTETDPHEPGKGVNVHSPKATKKIFRLKDAPVPVPPS